MSFKQKRLMPKMHLKIAKKKIYSNIKKWLLKDLRALAEIRSVMCLKGNKI